MRIYSLEDAPSLPRTVALGYFDGGHIGHSALFAETVRRAKEDGCESTVFTFPALATKRGTPLSRLSDRLDFFESAGIDSVVLVPVETVRNIPADAFVSEILIGRLSATAAVCGFNYRFGKGAEGDGTLLSRLLPRSTVLPPMLYEGTPVSTSRIREALTLGDIPSATAMLGRPYTVTGTVSHGKAAGRTLGFPTANIRTETALPRFGVYKTAVTVDGVRYTGLTDVGVRPTLEDAGETRVETFLCDFSGDLYEKEIAVSFLAFLREEMHFSSSEELMRQITRDLANLK